MHTCYGTMVLYPVKICPLYRYNKMLIGQPGRKYRRDNQNRRILEKGKAQSAVITQTQRKQDENASLINGTKPHG